MVENIERGFNSLARYALLVEGNPKKAAAVQAEKQRVTQFLVERRLFGVRRPASKIKEVLERRAADRFLAWQEHLSAVAQEALHVAGVEFVHGTAASVVKALRSQMDQGGDFRFIPTYADSTLARHIFQSGWHLGDRVTSAAQLPGIGIGNARRPIGELLTDEDFLSGFHYPGWLETMMSVSQTLPANTTICDLEFALMSFSPKIGPDLRQFRSVAARLSEVRRITRSTTD